MCVYVCARARIQTILRYSHKCAQHTHERASKGAAPFLPNTPAKLEEKEGEDREGGAGEGREGVTTDSKHRIFPFSKQLSGIKLLKKFNINFNINFYSFLGPYINSCGLEAPYLSVLGFRVFRHAGGQRGQGRGGA